MKKEGERVYTTYQYINSILGDLSYLKEIFSVFNKDFKSLSKIFNKD